MKYDHTIAEHEGDIIVPDGPDHLGWSDNGDFDHLYESLGSIPLETETIENGATETLEVDEPSKRKERQASLLKERGFLATSPVELVRATGLLRPDMQSPAGAAKYIAVIIRRQTNLKPKPEEPAAAGRAVIGEMIDFAKKARGDRAALEMMATTLENTHLLPQTAVTEVAGLRDWQSEGLLRRAFVDLQRLAETVEFVEGAGDDHLGDAYGSSDEQMQQKLEKFVGSLSIAEAKDLIYKSDMQHVAQLAFWTDRLNEIERHLADARFKAMTRAALVNLGVKRAE